MKNKIGDIIVFVKIDNVIEIIILINGHDVPQYFNPAAERLFGLPAEEVLGSIYRSFRRGSTGRHSSAVSFTTSATEKNPNESSKRMPR